LDIDHFKIVNDNFGHAAGDELLHIFARTLEGCLRPRDTVARFGGDEFAILLVDIANENRAVEVAARIQRSLSEPFSVDGQRINITASIGLVVSSSQHLSSGDYLRSADHAMYRAKSLGRARCEIFNENMHIRSLEFLAMEKDFTHALTRSEFVIHYQP